MEKRILRPLSKHGFEWMARYRKHRAWGDYRASVLRMVRKVEERDDQSRNIALRIVSQSQGQRAYRSYCGFYDHGLY